MLWYSTMIALGLVALVQSAERFVDGASAIAKRAGLTPMLIGLTIVSVGTSAPEILISVMSALADSGELAVGNALGSNIANVGLVLGVTLLLSNITLERDTTWIDLPLLLPFARWLRVIPVTERLCGAGLLQLEPLRAVISRGVGALLAVELFEVIAIRVIDTLQQLIRSPQLPERVRGLCSYQSGDLNNEREVIELLRLWLPLLLTRIGPAMRPQLQAVISHLVQQSLDRNVVPDALRRLPGLQNAESEFSRQLAESMVTSVLDLSKGAGNRIGQRDTVLESLGSEALDRLWKELAHTLEQEPVLSRSQDLLVALLEEIKRSSFRQIRDQGDVDALIRELDGLNFSPGVPTPKDQV